MLLWCTILFFLGAVAFLDSQYNYGQIFRSANALLFMLISLGLLFRIFMKIRAGKIEMMEEEILTLRKQREEWKQNKSTPEKTPTA